MEAAVLQGFRQRATTFYKRDPERNQFCQKLQNQVETEQNQMIYLLNHFSTFRFGPHLVVQNAEAKTSVWFLLELYYMNLWRPQSQLPVFRTFITLLLLLALLCQNLLLHRTGECCEEGGGGSGSSLFWWVLPVVLLEVLGDCKASRTTAAQSEKPNTSPASVSE